MYPHTKRYMDARNSFRFAPLHRMCDSMTLLHAQPTQITNYNLQMFIDSLSILQSISDEITITSIY
jgi:hypothetical protein